MTVGVEKRRSNAMNKKDGSSKRPTKKIGNLTAKQLSPVTVEKNTETP